MNVKLISLTPDAEKIIGYCARVSSPQNQDNPDVVGLLRYLIKHKHWSPFEMANMLVEIKTNRGIAAQILRHRSFSFQEFSQRYSEIEGFEKMTARRQAEKNRQSSVDDLPEETQKWWEHAQKANQEICQHAYETALELGIAKECARFLLPLSTKTTLYMNGTIRSWIHYLELRVQEDVQLEHREIAQEIKKIFCSELPIIAKAINWCP